MSACNYCGTPSPEIGNGCHACSRGHIVENGEGYYDRTCNCGLRVRAEDCNWEGYCEGCHANS